MFEVSLLEEWKINPHCVYVWGLERNRFYPEGKASINKHLNDTVIACSLLLSHWAGQVAVCSLCSGSKKGNSSAGLLQASQQVKLLLCGDVTILQPFVKRTVFSEDKWHLPPLVSSHASYKKKCRYCWQLIVLWDVLLTKWWCFM